MVSGSEFGGEAEHQDRRVGRVHLPDGRWIRNADGQIRACRVDRREHVLGGAVDIAGELELDGELGEAERARRGQLGDAGDLGELLLERRRHR